MEDLLIDLLKFTVPALVVFFTSFWLLKSYLDNDFKKREMELKQNNLETMLPLRLRAYERMTLFLERISPNNLLHRARKDKMSARQLHIALLENIRTEYEHNLSQQIYISPDSWELIKAVKEEIINIINNAAQNVDPKADSKKLSKAIYEYLINREHVLPTQKALNKLKKEVRELY